MHLEVNHQFLVSMMFASAALGYGIPKINTWERTWPWERWILYSLTITASIFFLWSILA